MPEHTSKYDTNPLPDPGDGHTDDGTPDSVDQSKQLRVNWTGPQPLTTVTPTPPSSGAGSTSGGSGSNGGGSGSKSSGNGSNGGGATASGGGSTASGGGDPDEYKRQVTEMFGPQYAYVKARPPEFLELVQNILDKARVVADRFNALRDSSEAALNAGWWGTSQTFGGEIGHQGSGKDMPKNPTDDAKGAKEFIAVLLPMQRATLQGTANGVALSGTLIQLLNESADKYATADQYSVFPDKSQISKEVDK